MCQTLDYAYFLGKKWTVVLLEEIALGKFDGFNNILKKSGLSPKILSIYLKEMVSIGLIEKAKSRKTIYCITEKGKDFRNIVYQIKSFNKKWGSVSCENKSCLECKQFSA